MGSSGTCMSRSRWSGPSDGSQAQREGGSSSRSPPWNSWGVESGSLEMCLARYLPMAVVPVRRWDEFQVATVELSNDTNILLTDDEGDQSYH
eukprot:scaffold25723_cov76-Amphora_coffeaeformis.AAC.1